jgi:hypothetical protein
LVLLNAEQETDARLFAIDAPFSRSAKSPNTKAYEKYLLLQLVNSTIEDVSI